MTPGAVMHLFVYGTLRTDYPQATPYRQMLVQACGEPVPATVPGRLYDLGDYPGLTPAENDAETVHGQLFSLSADASSLLRDLDLYEDVPGGLYDRVVLPATLPDRAQVPAYTYVYLHPVSPASRIRSGDYLAAFRID